MSTEVGSVGLSEAGEENSASFPECVASELEAWEAGVEVCEMSQHSQQE